MTDSFRTARRKCQITLATWRRIKYCPWCGSDIHRFYRKTYQHLADRALTDEHGWSAEQCSQAGAGDSVDERDR